MDVDIQVTDDGLKIGDKHIHVSAEPDPSRLDWGAMEVDIVIESTGFFLEGDKARKHIDAGAKRVIISAPGKNVDGTFCMGVNHAEFDLEQHFVVSNASCTTNCLAPIAKIVHEQYGITCGHMTTIHSVTNDQKILDLPHRDLRRARAAYESVIPTTTGAATAVGLVLPELAGKLNGMAVRVPSKNVSLVDLVAVVERETTKDELITLFHEASQRGPLAPYLGVSEEPLVSIDYNGNKNSATVDLSLIDVVDGKMLKIISWYDNESGYSNRVLDLAQHISNQMRSN
jgi:glyceraldehyde 3-phosphate dehydrogenase